MLFYNEVFNNPSMMNLFKAILFAVFVTALANTTDKSKCNVNNNYNSFYAGPNCKKIEQQLAEIKQEIRALKKYETGGSGGKGLYFLSTVNSILLFFSTCLKSRLIHASKFLYWPKLKFLNSTKVQLDVSVSLEIIHFVSTRTFHRLLASLHNFKENYLSR